MSFLFSTFGSACMVFCIWMQRCPVTLMDFRSRLSGDSLTVARHLQLQSCPWSTSFPSSGEKNTNANTIIPSFTWRNLFLFLKYAPELLKFLPHHLIKTASWVKSQLFIETLVPKSHPWRQQVFAESELAIARGTMSDTWYVPAVVSLIVWSSCVVFWSASLRVWWVNRSTHGFPLACEPWRISPCAQCWLLCSGEIHLDDSYHLENLFLQVDFSGLVSSYESERLSYGFPWSYVISPLMMLLVGIRPLQGFHWGSVEIEGDQGAEGWSTSQC